MTNEGESATNYDPNYDSPSIQDCDHPQMIQRDTKLENPIVNHLEEKEDDEKEQENPDEIIDA